MSCKLLSKDNAQQGTPWYIFLLYFTDVITPSNYEVWEKEISKKIFLKCQSRNQLTDYKIKLWKKNLTLITIERGKKTAKKCHICKNLPKTLSTEEKGWQRDCYGVVRVYVCSATVHRSIQKKYTNVATQTTVVWFLQFIGTSFPEFSVIKIR